MRRSLFKGALGVLILLALGTEPLLAQHHTDKPNVAAPEALSVGPENLPGQFPGIFAFDVSPDGQTLAVEFVAANAQNDQVMQVAEWDIPSKKLKTTKVVEGPAKQLMSNPQFQYDLRFTPDGLDLVALTGLGVVILNAQTLTPLRMIGLPSEPGPPPQFGWVLDSFGISGDGSKLAVISRGVGPTCGDHSTFRLFDLKSGNLLSSWQLHACMGASLSENGTRAFVRGNLVDTATGEILRTFPGGGGYFIDDTRFIKGFGYPEDPKPSDEKLAALGIFNVNTGKTEREMRYGQYGIVGTFAVARGSGIVAVMESWLNPKDLARDATHARGFVRLIVFGPSETEPFYVSPDIHDRPMFGSVYMARLSSDGRVVAYGGSTIHVLKVVYDSSEPGGTGGRNRGTYGKIPFL